MQEVIMQTALEAAKAIVVLLLPVLVGVAIKWLHRLGEETFERIMKVKDDRTRKLLSDAYSALESVAGNVVRSLQQTVVFELKQASKDGKLTPQEVEKLKRTAIDEIVKLLSPDQANYLRLNLGDFDGYLNAVIESQVLKLKGY